MMMESPNFQDDNHLATGRKVDRAWVRAIHGERHMRAKEVDHSPSVMGQNQQAERCMGPEERNDESEQS
jgi:hypothetical protein